MSCNTSISPHPSFSLALSFPLSRVPTQLTEKVIEYHTSSSVGNLRSCSSRSFAQQRHTHNISYLDHTTRFLGVVGVSYAGVYDMNAGRNMTSNWAGKGQGGGMHINNTPYPPQNPNAHPHLAQGVARRSADTAGQSAVGFKRSMPSGSRFQDDAQTPQKQAKLGIHEIRAKTAAVVGQLEDEVRYCHERCDIRRLRRWAQSQFTLRLSMSLPLLSIISFLPSTSQLAHKISCVTEPSPPFTRCFELFTRCFELDTRDHQSIWAVFHVCTYTDSVSLFLGQQQSESDPRLQSQTTFTLRIMLSQCKLPPPTTAPKHLLPPPSPTRYSAPHGRLRLPQAHMRLAREGCRVWRHAQRANRTSSNNATLFRRALKSERILNPPILLVPFLLCPLCILQTARAHTPHSS